MKAECRMLFEAMVQPVLVRGGSGKLCRRALVYCRRALVYCRVSPLHRETLWASGNPDGSHANTSSTAGGAAVFRSLFWGFGRV